MLLILPSQRVRRPLLILAASVLLGACNRGDGAPAAQAGGGAGQRGPNGGSGGGGGGPRGPGFGGPGGPGGRPSGPTAIEVLPVRRGSLAREATVAGVLSPIRTVGVNAQTGGAL